MAKKPGIAPFLMPPSPPAQAVQQPPAVTVRQPVKPPAPLKPKRGFTRGK